MTMYVGEELKVVVTAKDFDNDTALVNTDVTSTHIRIYDSDSLLVLQDNLTWDITAHEWFYKWDTTGRAAGTYKAQITLTGTDGLPSIEWKRIRLSRQPINV